MEIVELGADSKRLLMEIRDRLPAATASPPADLDRWEIFGPREQAVLAAWLAPDGQISFRKREDSPASGKGWRPLYAGKAI